MTEDFLSKIRGEYNQFTETEKKVADYILSSPKKVLFMSVIELAEACGVGDTNVSRSCKTMNYKGYQEFKILLPLSLHRGKQGFGQMEGDISLEDSFPRVAGKVLSSNIRTFKEAHFLLKEDVFWWAVECSHRAGRICSYGVGASMTTAIKVADKFLKIESKVYCVSDSHTQVMMAFTVSNGEVAIIFSCFEAIKDTIHVAQPARQAGAAIVCVTRFIKLPFTTCTDLTLLCGVNEGLLQVGSSSAEISQLLLIDMLYMEYYRTYYDKYGVNNEKTPVSIMERLCWGREKHVLK